MIVRPGYSHKGKVAPVQLVKERSRRGMPERFDYVNAKCPFFLSSTDTTIECEGCFSRSKIKNEFKIKAERDNVRKKFCDSEKYKDCLIAKTLDSKYK